MDENKFEWTDELVDALLESLGYTDSCDRKSTVMHFKSKQQSVSKEKDWEIVSYKSDWSGKIYDAKWGSEFPIHSVRRLSDGEIISVGDIDDFTGNEVMRMYIENNEMRVLTTSGWKPLGKFKKQNQ